MSNSAVKSTVIIMGAMVCVNLSGIQWGSAAQNRLHFGESIAIDGTDLLVGAPESTPDGAPPTSGRVYYIRRINGVWTRSQVVYACQANTSDFGGSLDISSGNAVVGDPSVINVDGSTGAVYSYKFDQIGRLYQYQILTPPAAYASGSRAFGDQVSISGDILVVADQAESHSGVSRGAIYLYRLQNGYWTFVNRLTAYDAQDNDHFGSSVAISEGAALNHERIIAIGAKADNVGGVASGSAYVYGLTGNQWTLLTKIHQPNLSSYGLFGFDVDITSDPEPHVIIGAPGNDDTPHGTSLRGSISIYKYTGGTWVLQLHQLGNTYEQLGRSVAFNYGNFSGSLKLRALASRPRLAVAPYASVYEMNSIGSWSLLFNLNPLNSDYYPAFGFAVALDDNGAVIGSHAANNEDGYISVYDGGSLINNFGPHEQYTDYGLCRTSR